TGDGGAGLTGNDEFWVNADSGPVIITDFRNGDDKLVLTGFDATPFGSDGWMAIGFHEGGLPDGDLEIDWLDLEDDLFFNAYTGELFRINPIEIDGHVGLGNDPELLVKFTDSIPTYGLRYDIVIA